MRLPRRRERGVGGRPLLQQSAHLSCKRVHLRLGDTLDLARTKVAKDTWAAPLGRLVCHARHDVDVDVRVAGSLGELDHVGLRTTSHGVERLGDQGQQHSELGGLVSGMSSAMASLWRRATSTSQPGKAES